MKKLLLLLTICLISFTSCTENSRARNFGGNMTIELPRGNKVTNITFKKGDLWYSYRPMLKEENPDTTLFVENSNFGIWEGTVTFIETK